MAISVNQKLERLIRDAWRQHETFNDRGIVVQPSMPILYFGDREAYHKPTTEPKIVTVGLNPSNREFPADDPWMRFEFPSGEPWRRFQEHRPVEDYLKPLNGYFKHNSYGWFSGYEKVLQGMGTSYYDRQDTSETNTALHTDLCSPLATKEKWGDIPADTQTELIEQGRPLWRELIDELAPDVIIASVARRHLTDLARKGGPIIDIENPRTVHTITTKKDGSDLSNPYHVLAWPYELSNGKTATLVYGQAMFTPFGWVSNNRKQEIGEQLVDYVR